MIGFIDTLYIHNSGLQEIQRYSYSTHFTVHRYTQWGSQSSLVVSWQRIYSENSTQVRTSYSGRLVSRNSTLLDYSSILLYESESHITTDGQPASLSWNKAPFWGLGPDLDYCLTVAGLFIWGDLSDERPGLSFTIATGLRQRSHFLVRVP
jgi:hypothetical protein